MSVGGVHQSVALTSQGRGASSKPNKDREAPNVVGPVGVATTPTSGAAMGRKASLN